VGVRLSPLCAPAVAWAPNSPPGFPCPGLGLRVAGSVLGGVVVWGWDGVQGGVGGGGGVVPPVGAELVKGALRGGGWFPGGFCAPCGGGGVDMIFFFGGCSSFPAWGGVWGCGGEALLGGGVGGAVGLEVCAQVVFLGGVPSEEVQIF